MLAQGKSLDICAIALEVLYFVTKHTCSILGSAFLSFHMVCNSKILPNTMWSLWCWQCCSIAYWNGSDSYGKIKKWFLMAESIPSPRTKWLIVVKTFFVVHYAGVCIPKFLCPGNLKGASLLARLAPRAPRRLGQPCQMLPLQIVIPPLCIKLMGQLGPGGGRRQAPMTTGPVSCVSLCVCVSVCSVCVCVV